MKHKKLIFFICYFLSQLNVLITSWTSHYYPGTISYIAHFTSLAVFLFLTIFLFFLFGKEIFKDTKLEAELYTIAQQQHLKETYIEEMNKRLEDTKEYQQNTKKKLEYLRDCLLEGEYTRSLEYFEGIYQTFQEVSYCMPCSDNLLNAILDIKRQYAEKHLIHVEYKILLPKQYNLVPTSLSCIFFNLLDNGIESCIRSNSNSACLRLSTNYTEEWLTIYMRNTKAVDEQFSHRTSKPDIYAHGFGLGIIEELVHDFEGLCEWKDLGDSFESTIMLKYTATTAKRLD